MDARSALFDLYGDHLRSRGAQAPVAALVRMLASLGIASPAVRTAISRMVRQGWLQPVRIGAVAGYALTPRAVSRLDEAAERIYSRGSIDWDGGWHLVVVERVRERTRRERVQASLRYLGYAQLDDTTWLSPHPSPELEALRESERVRVEPFAARYDGDARGLLARTWDLDTLARAYRNWLADARALMAPVGEDATDEVIFAARSKLVHGWRKFLFRDPGLPVELLPQEWPGTAAAEFFNVESARLLPAASGFVDCCLAAGDSRAARTP
ncbi:MAG TPA: PaaX family transcriptional regulator C-terminal domain-containing protein [Streptosporangiaceae bacterium]